MKSISFDSRTFRSFDFKSEWMLRELSRYPVPDVASRVETGYPEIEELGALVLQTPNPSFVVCPIADAERIPQFFMIGNVETALGFEWPVFWFTETATAVPVYDQKTGGKGSLEIIVIEGTAHILYDHRDDLWHQLMPNACCSKTIVVQ